MASQGPVKGQGLKTYVLRRGDSLASVARRFKVTREDLLDMNQLTSAQFKAGRRIQIPPAIPKDFEEELPARTASAGSRRTPAPLVTVPAIPMHPPLGSPASQGTESASVAPPTEPQTMPAPVPGPPVVQEVPPPAVVPTERTLPGGKALRAAPGDTLAKLARAHQVPLGELMRLNPAAVRKLHPGDLIRLPGAEGPPATADPAMGSRALVYRVKKGDTLASIARRHGVSIQDLKAWNNLKGERLLKGQRLHLGPR
jgi:LysM repeat protein